MMKLITIFTSTYTLNDPFTMHHSRTMSNVVGVFARELLNHRPKLRSIAGPNQHRARYVGYFHCFLWSFMHHLYAAAAALLALLVGIRIISQFPHVLM
ncbi:hypothetical protein VIGAN_05136900 [Vigna angularis var. angularis]|uniref:Uncharacterized protein n=1 Tax=Vigna angularis var. angularis TaxID=157739 RepID=A0A0S3S539_PHAAN|nr:hypothetical protein VIGAN_05136900 [Vigna angularis var. angularis]